MGLDLPSQIQYLFWTFLAVGMTGMLLLMGTLTGAGFLYSISSILVNVLANDEHFRRRMLIAGVIFGVIGILLEFISTF